MTKGVRERLEAHNLSTVVGEMKPRMTERGSETESRVRAKLVARFGNYYSKETLLVSVENVELQISYLDNVPDDRGFRVSGTDEDDFPCRIEYRKGEGHAIRGRFRRICNMCDNAFSFLKLRIV